MQALLAEHAWDWRAALTALQRFILDHLGDPGAVLVPDETAELKQGQMTVGVSRQHAGITGQIENCQTIVLAAYVAARAHALLDFRLYLPKAWCDDAGRRERAHVPDGTDRQCGYRACRTAVLPSYYGRPQEALHIHSA
jgi:SRSO17 transposase